MLARVSIVALGMIAGQNALITEKCNACTSHLGVAKVSTGIIDSQLDAAHLRDSIHHLPPVRMTVPATTSCKDVLAACEFSIALWPRRLIEQEMSTALLFCLVGGEEIDGEERAGVLKHTFDYIENNLLDVTAVQKIDEQRDSKSYVCYVLLFADGSLLCQCRTLQVLGLGCRHLNAEFRFHVGLLHQHWLTEKARGSPEGGWPSAATPRWIVGDQHGGAAGGTEGAGVASPNGVGGEWKAFVGSSETVQNVLVLLEGEGPNPTGQTIVRRRLKDARTSKQHFVLYYGGP